jgi:hypothetical protein
MDNQLADYRKNLVARLQAQPSEFNALLEAVPTSAWHTRRATDGTTLHQLLTHTRDVEILAFWPRVQRILAEVEPHLEAFPFHRWSLENTYHPDELPSHIISSFSRNRAEAVALFHTLTSEQWSRSGFHPPSGPRTLLWWAERMYNHARNHLLEIQAALKE